MTNQTLHLIASRRSHRAYKPAQISPEQLEALMTAALLLASWQGPAGLWPWARWRGRWLALALSTILPVLLAGLLHLQPDWARVIWPLVALSVLAGTLVERRLAR